MSLFINPSALPGGRDWSAACAAAAAVGDNGAANTNALSETLSCDASPAGGLAQVLLLLCTYGYILYTASGLISDGSELLLLVPSLKDVVGSIVLPVLGAIPDGCIVFFSGLGPNAQEEISVGVGALAGSTCMLLTIPWFLSIFAGRVNILPGGHANYRPLRRDGRFDKLFPPGNMNPNKTGVAPHEIVRKNGIIMILTAVPFLIIQLSAFLAGDLFAKDVNPQTVQTASRIEKLPAAFCFVIAMGSCALYLAYQATSPSAAENVELRSEKVNEQRRKDGTVSLAVMFSEFWDVAHRATSYASTESTSLVASRSHPHETEHRKFKRILEESFSFYDENGDHRISTTELSQLMIDLGYRLPGADLAKLLREMAKPGQDSIEREDFIRGMEKFIREDIQKKIDARSRPTVTEVDDNALVGQNSADNEEDSEEHEDVPHKLRDDDPKTQIRKVLQRSLLMMASGTALVLIFSDPMVDVLSDVGARIGVSPFYISFVLAPLASNASELLASYQYACKKTSKTVTISFSTLLGAAILNNTFVLAIFMALIYLKGLAWTFTAETIAIVFVEFVMYRMSQKRVMYVRDSYIVLALFPISLLIVIFLENVVGLD